ncbi:MAG: NAD(P)H-hydrate epimerase [Acidimicrobiales bacterium]
MDLTSFPSVAKDRVGWVTESEMAEIDRVMIEDLRIELIQMMENAGRNLARVALETFAPRSVAVLAGPGGNGGGDMVAARHLANADVEVTVIASRSQAELNGVPQHQLDILHRMGVPMSDDLVDADLVVDALLGYSLRGEPRGRPLELMTQLRAHEGPVVALDTPSGLDVTTGAPLGAVVRADVTMTLALPKTGLRDAVEVGELLLADISVPPSVTGPYGPAAPTFAASPVLRLI